MDRAAVCRVVVCFLLGATCYFNAPDIRAQALPGDAPVPDSNAQLEQAIEQKLAQIAALKKELEELRNQLANGQQIEIELKVYEVNITKMRKSGVDISSLGDDGKPVTKEVKNVSDFPPNAGAFLEALAKNNIAKLSSQGKVRVNAGEKCKINGQKLPYPELPRTDKQDLYDVTTKVLAKRLENGVFRIQLATHFTSLDYGRVSNIEGQKVPAIRESFFDVGFECNENQDCLVPNVPELRTMVIRTERGEHEVQEEIQRVVVVRVKKFGDEAPQNEVQPASAFTPFGQGAPYERQ